MRVAYRRWGHVGGIDIDIVGGNTGPSHTADAAAAGRQARAKRGSAPSNATAAAEAKPGAHSRAKKRRRRLLVLPDSQLHEEQEEAHKRIRKGKGSGALTAGPMTGSRAGHVDPGSAEEERAADGAAASTSEVVADSMEFGSCMADAAGDIMDDVSSADTGHHEHPAAQQAQRERPDAQQAQPDALQGQHQAQQQPGVLTMREQGRAVGAAGQLVGLGQLLSGDIQWVGPRIDPPTQMCLAPSQHQTYYKAFSRVCYMLSCLQTSSSSKSATFASSIRCCMLAYCLGTIASLCNLLLPTWVQCFLFATKPQAHLLQYLLPCCMSMPMQPVAHYHIAVCISLYYAQVEVCCGMSYAGCECTASHCQAQCNSNLM